MSKESMSFEEAILKELTEIKDIIKQQSQSRISFSVDMRVNDVKNAETIIDKLREQIEKDIYKVR